MTMTPYAFQRYELDRLRARGYVGLLNLQTGLGKTPMGAWAIQESGAEVVLVSAPAQTMETAWMPTIRSILGVEAREIGNSTKAKRQALEDFTWGEPGIYLVTPQLLTRTDISAWSGDMLILDEIHGVSAPGGKGQRQISGFHPKDVEPLRDRFPMRLGLSGTALRNKFELAWSHSRFFWPERDLVGELSDKNFYRWREDRMSSRLVYTNQKDRFGNTKTVKEFFGESEPGRWVNEAPLVITHFKRGTCCEFAPNGHLPTDAPVERHVTIPLLKEQKEAVSELEEMMMTWLGDNPLIVDIPLTKATRIRQMTLGVPTVGEEGEVSFSVDCKSPYLDHLLDMLTNAYDDEAVVVYTSSQKFAEVTVARLNQKGIPAFEYSGATRKNRDQMVTEFGTTYRVCVAVLAAVAEGLDGLQRVSKTEVWFDRSTDETLNEQAQGRLDRTGGIGQVERIYLHDDLGLSEGRYSAAIEKRLEHNRSLKLVQ